MGRVLRIVVLGALSAALLSWVIRGLFGVDQRGSFLPWVDFGPFPQLFPAILIGVTWAVMLTFGGSSWKSTSKTVRGPVAVATLVESRRTSLTVNDVPQYQLFVQVRPAGAPTFLSQCRLLVSAAEQATLLRTGSPIPVHYDLSDPDYVTPADASDPDVREAVLRWRVERGLIDRRLVRARIEGTPHRAAVVAVRPTGRYRDGQTELEVTVLISPEGTPPFQASSPTFVHPSEVGGLQVGSPVWAYYLPGDASNVAVELAESLDGGPDVSADGKPDGWARR